jgi:lysophospholipase L1-like esterase
MTIFAIFRNRVILYLAIIVGAALAVIYINIPDERRVSRPSVLASRPDWYPTAAVHIDAYGDSITYGESIDFMFDENGRPRRTNESFQGWPELLGRLLTIETGTDTAVWNMGYPGDRAKESVKGRLPGLLEMNTGADRALLLMGTNDSNDFDPTISGKGCSGEDCRDTYKGEVTSVIHLLKGAGRNTIYLGLLTPAWGSDLDVPYSDPLDPAVASRNNRIQEYNEIIRNELTQLPGVKLGPDLFSCFLSPTVNRFSLFEDSLHPNELGYTFIASLWLETISGAGHKKSIDQCKPPVYILESLDSYAHGHKQNVLAEGDEYYVDESFVLVNIPQELKNGIWVMPANNDRQNTDPEYLEFNTGSSPVTVYIAYDPAGHPPASSSHDFAAVELESDLTSTDDSLPRFSLVQANDVTGTVKIGGNRSAGGGEQQQAYLVVVVP